MPCTWSGAARVLLRSHTTCAGKLGWVRAVSNSSAQSNSSTKPPLKKPKTPQGRFDETEQATKEKDPLENITGDGDGGSASECIRVSKKHSGFPDNINPVTKEKGGPRGPEPTRYGDWERKGRCIDF